MDHLRLSFDSSRDIQQTMIGNHQTELFIDVGCEDNIEVGVSSSMVKKAMPLAVGGRCNKLSRPATRTGCRLWH